MLRHAHDDRWMRSRFTRSVSRRNRRRAPACMRYPARISTPVLTSSSALERGGRRCPHCSGRIRCISLRLADTPAGSSTRPRAGERAPRRLDSTEATASARRDSSASWPASSTPAGPAPTTRNVSQQHQAAGSLSRSAISNAPKTGHEARVRHRGSSSLESGAVGSHSTRLKNPARSYQTTHSSVPRVEA